ncbi:hypothetical protein ASPZODRAFT_134745 [Penicilliopsis zonata CBS 506.65]|uniref:Uncharacterized protein n=1 Tax=Penicilliopsis zonata CBS 506.65 TaxID=1073090 RepID=A0A1L9SBV7_9EURO|nr:hypothetical protein ASPZODRAFT_134745 [Penicilliopsis zonata CBS 506.65]OJJ44661.1 hypothetical protein ASPZODRAFT_134745 [Penicilliopsis zonata CBS 506.65]
MFYIFLLLLVLCQYVSADETSGQVVLHGATGLAKDASEKITGCSPFETKHPDDDIRLGSTKRRIPGYSREWSGSGAAYDVHVRLTQRSSRSAARAVSSLDWAHRWEVAIDCLSLPGVDSLDMFDMDELAVEAFWDRVWACYLPYASGG